MAENPKVFISYSHDSPEHKQWVSELAARLRRNGIDAILDQWDVGLGDDVTRFMERGIVNADRVLVICTEKYVNKANTGEGGVDYERMIINAELVQNLGTDKFIPIIRQASGKQKTPTFLGTRVYADFRNDHQFGAECEKLIRELHEMPIIEKPPLGENPFPSVELDTHLTEIPEQLESASEVYKVAAKLARAGDVLGWRELIKRIRPNVFKILVQWRQSELDGQEPKSKEQLFQAVDKAVDIISPLMCIALVGVESRSEQFRDQKSLLDDLLNIAGWNPAGYTTWVELPYALGYIYHSLHGGLCMSTNQLNLASDLARIKIPVAGGTKFPCVWEMSQLRGYTQSIGGNILDSWKYLKEAYERWNWLSLIFEDRLEYQASLIAYYMCLSIHELATVIDSDRQDTLNTRSEYYFRIPLAFLSGEGNAHNDANSLLRRNPETLERLWACSNVTREQMENSWEDWMRLSDEVFLKYEFQYESTRLINPSDVFGNFFESL